MQGAHMLLVVLQLQAICQTAATEAMARCQPDIILVSAGFDCAKGDPHGDCELQPEVS